MNRRHNSHCLETSQCRRKKRRSPRLDFKRRENRSSSSLERVQETTNASARRRTRFSISRQVARCGPSKENERCRAAKRASAVRLCKSRKRIGLFCTTEQWKNCNVRINSLKMFTCYTYAYPTSTFSFVPTHRWAVLLADFTPNHSTLENSTSLGPSPPRICHL